VLGHCFLSLWCQRCKKGGGGAATQREGGKKGCRPFMFNDGIFNDRNSRCIAKINLYANPVYTTFEKPRFASSLVSLHLFMFNVIRKLEERREREEGKVAQSEQRWWTRPAVLEEEGGWSIFVHSIPKVLWEVQ